MREGCFVRLWNTKTIELLCLNKKIDQRIDMNKILLEAVVILFVVGVTKAQYGIGYHDAANPQEGKHLKKLFDSEVRRL